MRHKTDLVCHPWQNYKKWAGKIISIIFLQIMTCVQINGQETLIPHTFTGILGQSVGLPCNLERNTYKNEMNDLNLNGDQNSRKTIDLYGNDISLILWYRHGSSGVPIYAVDVRQSSLTSAPHQSYLEQEIIDLDRLHSYSPNVKQFNDTSIGRQAEAYHVFQGVKGRFVFHLGSNPPKLWIRRLETADEGEYRCRVDYKGDRTQNFVIYLKIAVPPTSLQILDGVGKDLSNKIGPYEENEYLTLTCVSVGGKPLPQLNWYSNDILIDESYLVNALTGKVHNELIVGRLKREHLNQKFECRAQTNETLLSFTFVTIDLYLKPLTVNLTQLDKRLTSGHKAEFECSSVGSRPPAEIVFFKGNKPLRSSGHVVESRGNQSLAKLVTILNIADHNKKLSCRAFNPKLSKPEDNLEQSLDLDLKYLPQLTVNLGAAIKPDSIKEGSDVYLECSVNSNPSVQEIQWTFNGNLLMSNKSDRILTINHTLILQQVKRERRGQYACIARNALGESVSNPFFLRIKYAPTCKTKETIIYTTEKNELLQLTCEYLADPTELQFSWTLFFSDKQRHLATIENNLNTFNTLQNLPNDLDSPILKDGQIYRSQYGRNNLSPSATASSSTSGSSSYASGPTLKQVSLAEFSSNHTLSTLAFMVSERTPYGEIQCMASNTLGKAIDPCKFLIHPQGPPCAPVHCELKHSVAEISLVCSACNRKSTNDPSSVHLTRSSKLPVLYNLRVYMPVNNGDLIREQELMHTYENKEEGPHDTKTLLNGNRDNFVNMKTNSKSMMKLHRQQQSYSRLKYDELAQQVDGALLVQNLTNAEKPVFTVQQLKPATVYILLLMAYNGKGVSEVKTFSVATLGTPERQMSMDSIDQVTFSPLLIILIIFVSIIVCFSIVIVVIIRIKSDKSHSKRNHNLNDTHRKKKPKRSESIVLNNMTNLTDNGPNKVGNTADSISLEVKENNYSTLNGKYLPEKNMSVYDYHELAQDTHNSLYTPSQHYATATPSPAPSSTNTGQPLSLSYSGHSSGYFPPAGSNSCCASMPPLQASHKRVMFLTDCQSAPSATHELDHNLYSNLVASQSPCSQSPCMNAIPTILTGNASSTAHSVGLEYSAYAGKPVHLPYSQASLSRSVGKQVQNGSSLLSANDIFSPVTYHLTKDQLTYAANTSTNHGNHATPV